MFIASKLREENIVEYLLYMWQIEDLIRAFGLEIDSINKNIVEPYDLEEEDKKQLYEWYESLIDMMRSENLHQKGHLQLNKNIIIELNGFHADLMKSGEEPDYNSRYYALLPSVALLRQKQSDTQISDIEIALNFLYGVMLLKMKKAEISVDTESTLTEVSAFLARLNHHYQRYQKGELRFEK